MAQLPSGTLTGILRRGVGRYTDVRRANITIIGKVSDSIKPMIGPNGMNKMLLSPTGVIIITKSGRTTLENVELSNPITKLLVDLARTQSDMAGDGTKTAVVLTGELLKKADRLLKMKIHPRVIIDGYQKAATKALEVLEQNSIDLSIDDEATLLNLARTIIGGKASGKDRDKIAKLAVSSLRSATDTSQDGKVDLDNIDVRKKSGGSFGESSQINGLIIYKNKPYAEMPNKILNAKLALIGSSIDPFVYENGEVLREYTLNRPDQMMGFKEGERQYYRGLMEVIKGAGADALFCQKRISKEMQILFAKERKLAFELVSEKDMLRLARASGAQIVLNVGELSREDLGSTGQMEFRKISGDEMLFIEHCPFTKATTVLIRGGSAQVADEYEAVFNECLRTLAIALEQGKAVPGGGAVEMEIWKEMKNYTGTFQNREQLAVDAFGDAIEEIPIALASNRGEDPLISIVKLRNAHGHPSRGAGADRYWGISAAPKDDTLLDSFRAKQHAIKTAAETASLVLSIGDIIMVTNPGKIKRAEAAQELERKRIQEEKLRIAFRDNKALKEVTQLDGAMMERVKNPETY
jgi:chaperonin GroEL (HSP60 family)